MSSIDDQLKALKVVPESETQYWKPYNPNPAVDSTNPFSGGLQETAAEYDRGEAMRFAATLGISDTFRGVKQLAGFDRLEMATDQKVLNILMENPEWGSDVKLAYFGSLFLDPIGWLTPASKVAQLARMGYKFSKLQKARKLAVSGAIWGTVGGYTGYVDNDSSNRLFNTLTGTAGGAILAPALGMPAAALGKFIASKKGKDLLRQMTPEEQDTFVKNLSEKAFPDQEVDIERLSNTKISLTGTGGETIVDFTNRKTAKELLENPQAALKEFTGEDSPTLTGNIKRFYYEKFQPAKQRYEDGKRRYLYKPLILENPIASLGAGAGAFGGNAIFGDDIDKYINRLEDEGDMDSGPWRNALKTSLMAGGAILGFGAFKKGKIGGQSVQDFIGRRVIDNFKLSNSFIKLKEGAYLDFNDISYQFTEIAERAAKLSDDQRRILYYFLDGQTDNIADLSKEAKEIGLEAREIIRETGQMMVDAGMLKPSTFLTNQDSYIHREYFDKMKPKFLREAGTQVDEELKIQNTNGRLSLIGVELKARGHIIRLNPKTDKVEITKLEKEGYEKFGRVVNGMQPYRRQLTKAEREAKGEIEEAAYAIKSTGELMLNDLAVYKFYSDVNSNFAYITKKDLDSLLKIINGKSKKYTKDEKAFAKALYNTHKNSGRKLYDDLSPEEQADLVLIKSTRMPKTGLNKYGDLAGRYIQKDMADDIIVQKAFSDGDSFLGKLYKNEYFQSYRRLNAVWKRSKTSWNPTVHTNNIVSNFFLLDAHNVSLDTFLEHGFKVYTKKGQDSLNKLDLGFGESNTYEDLVRLGVFDAGLTKTELRIGMNDWKKAYAEDILKLKLKRSKKTDKLGRPVDDPIADTEDILELSTSIAGKSYSKYLNFIKKKNPIRFFDRKLTDLYQREDQMFRVALYVDRLQKRIPELDQFTKGSKEYTSALEQIKRSAAKEAKKGFIDYNIQSPFINILRDTGLPFFSYTYRIIPILAKTATLQPSKFAKWAAIGYALDYAGRERSKQETEYERSLMDEKRLARAFGLPFMPPTFLKVGDIARGAEQFAQKRFDYALGWGLDKDAQGNKLPQTSNYADITRFLPGGDVLGQTTPEQGGRIAGLPAPLQPSFGLVGEIVWPLLLEEDPFTGRELKEDFMGRLNFTAARLVPNNPLLGLSGLQKLFGSDERNDFYDSWAHKKIMNALERNPDSSDYAPDLPVLMAVAQTMGIKIWPIDTRKLNTIFSMKYKRDKRELEKLIKKKYADLRQDYYQTATYDTRKKQADKSAREIQEKIDDLLIKARLISAKKFKRRERKFGEVPLDVMKSLGETISEKFD